jgi:hypothetical protein
MYGQIQEWRSEDNLGGTIGVMEIDPNMMFQKLRGLSHMPMAGLALPAIIRDSETGQVNWSNVITGGLTACVIAAGTSLISLNSKVAELAIIAAQRGQYIDQIPAALERLRAQEKAVDALVTGNASATSERFRTSDASRMKAEIESRFLQELAKLESRMDRESGRSRK